MLLVAVSAAPVGAEAQTLQIQNKTAGAAEGTVGRSFSDSAEPIAVDASDYIKNDGAGLKTVTGLGGIKGDALEWRNESASPLIPPPIA